MQGKNYASVWSCYQDGFGVNLVKVEANIKKGIPRNTITGQPDSAIRESIERIRIAIENSGFHYPMQNLIINLSPAEFRKSGTQFDLPMISAILLATGQIDFTFSLEETVFLGEVGLDGRIHGLKGIVNILLHLKKMGVHRVVIPKSNVKEANIIQGIHLIPVANIHSLKNDTLQDSPSSHTQVFQPHPVLTDISLYPHQMIAFRGMQIALAGRHHMMMVGSPGSGKTMISRLGKILQPPLDEDEIAERLGMESLQGTLCTDKDIFVKRPFRAPHHTSSEVSIVGGGHPIKMGEITLAHHGILFLDELAEFKPRVIQSLREPMEEQMIQIARANRRVIHPAGFLLFASTNPCPCGYFNHREKNCFCGKQKIKNYLSRFNGPFLDRVEIEIELHGESSLREKTTIHLDVVYASIVSAVAIQKERFKHCQEKYNGYTRFQNLHYLRIHQDASRLLRTLTKHYSVRKVQSIHKVARTIADLSQNETILEEHIYEALHFSKLNELFTKIAA